MMVKTIKYHNKVYVTLNKIKFIVIFIILSEIFALVFFKWWQWKIKKKQFNRFWWKLSQFFTNYKELNECEMSTSHLLSYSKTVTKIFLSATQPKPSEALSLSTQERLLQGSWEYKLILLGFDISIIINSDSALFWKVKVGFGS